MTMVIVQGPQRSGPNDRGRHGARLVVWRAGNPDAARVCGTDLLLAMCAREPQRAVAIALNQAILSLLSYFAPVSPSTSSSISGCAAKPIRSRNKSASGVFSKSARRFIMSSVISGSLNQVVCRNPTLPGEPSMTDCEAACSLRLLRARFASGYVTSGYANSWDTNRRGGIAYRVRIKDELEDALEAARDLEALVLIELVMSRLDAPGPLVDFAQRCTEFNFPQLATI
jgi:hypothetical protein